MLATIVGKCNEEFLRKVGEFTLEFILGEIKINCITHSSWIRVKLNGEGMRY